MNMILRLIYTILRAMRQPKLDFFDTSVMKFMVLPFDLDINRHMTNSRYHGIMDLGRIDYMIRTQFWQKARRQNYSPVLGSSTIRWRQSLKCFDLYELHTKIIGWDNKWFYVQQRMYKGKDLISDAIIKGIFVGKAGSVSMSELNKKLGLKLISPILPDKVNLWKDCEAAMRHDTLSYHSPHPKHSSKSSAKSHDAFR